MIVQLWNVSRKTEMVEFFVGITIVSLGILVAALFARRNALRAEDAGDWD